MANRFEFVSPGAQMGESFIRAMAEREAMRRQAILDEQNRRESEARIRMAAEQEARMRDAEARMGQMADDDWARERTDRAGANEAVAPAEVARLQRAGYGGRVDERLGSSSLAMPIMPFTPDSPMTTPTTSAGGTFLRPGFQYEQMRQAESARQELAAQSAAAAAEKNKDTLTANAEKAAADRASREEMASQANQTRILIAGMAGAQRQQAADEKREEKDKKEAEANRLKEANTKSSIDMRDKVIARVDQLINIDPKSGAASLKPGVGALYGGFQGAMPEGMAGLLGGQAAGTARAALNGLISLLDIDTIKTMKEQSRTGATGFGALSEKELAVLENAATTLRGRTMDEKSALMELVRIRNEMITARYNAEQELKRQQAAQAQGGTQGGAPRRGRVLSVRPAGQ